jgi:hypothetical protein
MNSEDEQIANPSLTPEEETYLLQTRLLQLQLMNAIAQNSFEQQRQKAHVALLTCHHQL